MDDSIPTQMYAFLAIVFSVWFGSHAFVAWRLSAPLSRGPASWTVIGSVAALAIAWPIVLQWTRQVPSESPLALVRSLNWLYFGMFSVLLVMLVVKELSVGGWLLAERATRGEPVSPERRDFLHTVGAGLAVLITGVTGGLGWRGATRIAPIVDVEVLVAGLDPRLDGFTIAQISDIHIGQPVTKSELVQIVERTNSIGADLIAVTGDLIDGRVDVFAPDTDPITDLDAPHGVYFVTGNHEYYSGAKEWEQAIRARGLRVLTNEHDVLDVDGAQLVVAGVTDYTAAEFVPADASDPAKAFAGAPADAAFNLLLAHQPKSAVAASRTPAQLQLSGHTHGGQYWPFSLVIDLFHPVTSGLSSYEDLQVYVSRGTGVWGPRMRVGAPNEITRLVLRTA